MGPAARVRTWLEFRLPEVSRPGTRFPALLNFLTKPERQRPGSRGHQQPPSQPPQRRRSDDVVRRPDDHRANQNVRELLRRRFIHCEIVLRSSFFVRARGTNRFGVAKRRTGRPIASMADQTRLFEYPVLLPAPDIWPVLPDVVPPGVPDGDVLVVRARS
jgi:hypothetical protein